MNDLKNPITLGLRNSIGRYLVVLKSIKVMAMVDVHFRETLWFEMMRGNSKELAKGERFEFGENRARFLELLIEVAKPNEVLHFYSELGFKPQQIRTCGKGRGCNEFVFRRDGVA
jgi:hypothetical protein